MVLDDNVGSLVPDKGEFVKGAEDGLEVSRGCDEERDILKIGIVFGHVGDEVVDVVRALPPTNGQPAAEISHECSNQSVSHKVARNSTVSSIVCGKHDLLLQSLSVLRNHKVDTEDIPRTCPGRPLM